MRPVELRVKPKCPQCDPGARLHPAGQELSGRTVEEVVYPTWCNAVSLWFESTPSKTGPSPRRTGR